MEEYTEENPKTDKSIKGYQIVIVILAVILGAISFMYYRQVNTMKADFQIEKDTLSNRLSNLRSDYENVRTENDTMSRNLEIERNRVDSLMDKLNRERSFNRSKMREYEKEVGTLQAVLRGFVHQIDSLNTLNRNLMDQNVKYRKEITAERLAKEKAIEQADELNTKVRQGAVLRARNISLVALSQNDKEMTRAARAARLRVDFIISQNELATPGERNVYAQISQDGFILANTSNAVFNYEGSQRIYSAMREVDYQNEDLSVSLYYNGEGITSGTYSVSIYMDGHLIGSNEIMLR